MSSSRRGDNGWASAIWLLLVFVPLAFLLIAPAAVEATTRYNAGVRFQNCVQLTAAGLRIWASQTYPADAWASIPASTALAQANSVYEQTLCARGISASGLSGGWRIVEVSSPGTGAYTVTVEQPYASPRGMDWFTPAVWTLSQTSWAYQHPAS